MCSQKAFFLGSRKLNRVPLAYKQNNLKKLETNERLCSFSIGAPVPFHGLHTRTKVTALQLCRGEV